MPLFPIHSDFENHKGQKPMGSSSTSVQDGVTRIRFTFLLKQQKNRQHETMVLKSLDFRYV